MANPAVQLGTLALSAHFSFNGEHGVVIGRTPQGVQIRRRLRKRDRYDQQVWVWVADEWSAATLVSPDLAHRRMPPISV